MRTIEVTTIGLGDSPEMLARVYRPRDAAIIACVLADDRKQSVMVIVRDHYNKKKFRQIMIPPRHGRQSRNARIDEYQTRIIDAEIGA